MVMFVHLTSESRLSRIRRKGIATSRILRKDAPRGVYAMPVTRDFYMTHQWLRELKRWKAGGPMIAIYFRVGDSEPVWLGHYSSPPREMTAARAVAAFMTAEQRHGSEAIIPSRIAARQVHRVRRVPQVIGWRYFPAAKGRTPICVCEYCTRGQYGARRLRARLEGAVYD